MKAKIIITLLIFSNISLIYASSEDITLTLQQKEYYFQTGEQATIPLQTKNTYETNISGKLTSSLTQKIQTQNSLTQSSSSNSIPATILKGENEIGINFGTSSSPATLEINLKFEYFQEESRSVILGPIKIHFVENSSQKQNQQNQQQASSQSQTNQQQKQIQEKMEQLQSQSDQTQSKLTNSQAPQDSSALKKQIQEQNQELEKQKQNFQKSLEQNKELSKENQKMLNQGYQLKDMQLNPSSNNSGSFEMKYKKQNGDEASIKGEMQNNKITNLETQTAEEKKEALSSLEQNKEFQKFDKELKNENYQNTKTEITKNGNETNIKMQYTNEKNQTATITAKLENQAVEKVDLEKESSKSFWNWLIIILSISLIIIAIIFLYKKYNLKTKKEEIPQKPKQVKPYNYKKDSKALLEKSKKLFKESKYKDAYSLSSQAIRLYLSHHHSLKKEITNDEIIKYLKSKNQNTKLLKETLDLCSLVEFAKYSPNKSDFNKITTFAEKLIK